MADIVDTREQLEVDMIKLCHMDMLQARPFLELLDRQAVITERKASEWHKKFCAWCEQVTDRRIAELTAEVEKHRQRANDAERGLLSDEWYVARDRYEDDIAELTAERDQLSRDLDAEHALVVQFEHDNEELKAERDKLKGRLENQAAYIDGVVDSLCRCEVQLVRDGKDIEKLTTERDRLQNVVQIQANSFQKLERELREALDGKAE